VRNDVHRPVGGDRAALDRQRAADGGEDAAAGGDGRVAGDGAVADQRDRVVAEVQAAAFGEAPGGRVAADGAVLHGRPAVGADGDAAAAPRWAAGDDHAAEGQDVVGHGDGPAGRGGACVALGEGQAGEGDGDGRGHAAVDLEDAREVVAADGDDP